MTDIPEDYDPSVHFQVMAQRIIHNAGATFGGAAVIIPPAGGGVPIEVIVLDDQADVIQFYALVQARIARNVDVLEDRQRNKTAFGNIR